MHVGENLEILEKYKEQIDKFTYKITTQREAWRHLGNNFLEYFSTYMRMHVKVL